MELTLVNTYSVNKRPKPAKLMTEQEYKSRVQDLSATPNFLEADDAFLDKLQNLCDDLKDMITYNTDTLTNGGTVYYVSNSGNDENDGLSPEKAWATLEKVNTFPFSEPSTVLFERGSSWRGYLSVNRSNMFYSAYGEGLKPKIISAYDGIAHGEWVKTEYDNVWRLDTPFPEKDIPMIVYDDGVTYGDKKFLIKDLSENLDFMYNGELCSSEEVFDHKIYVYFDKGNPAEHFKSININMLIKPADCSVQHLHDVTMHNLEFVYGRGVFFATRSKNIRMSYCVSGWGGGHCYNKEHLRYGGGAGAWHSCDNMVFDNCYFYQQFDSGVSPQYHWRDTDVSFFKDFITYNCLFETTKWTLEYFTTQHTSNENRFENLYFGYNLCRLGGYGYGDRKELSAYVKSWGHENPCINSKFEYNIFDRAANISIEVIGHAPGLRGKHVSYEHIPAMNNNIYIEPKNKVFANVNHIKYEFNEASHITMQKLGVETDAVYIFCDKKDDEVISAEAVLNKTKEVTNEKDN